VETIGDAYLAVCGAPVETNRHAENTALLSLAMMRAVRKFTTKGAKGKLNIRVGIHSGSCVAGVSMSVCVCVCVCVSERQRQQIDDDVCVCVCVCIHGRH